MDYKIFKEGGHEAVAVYADLLEDYRKEWREVIRTGKIIRRLVVVYEGGFASEGYLFRKNRFKRGSRDVFVFMCWDDGEDEIINVWSGVSFVALFDNMNSWVEFDCDVYDADEVDLKGEAATPMRFEDVYGEGERLHHDEMIDKVNAYLTQGYFDIRYDDRDTTRAVAERWLTTCKDYVESRPHEGDGKEDYRRSLFYSKQLGQKSLFCVYELPSFFEGSSPYVDLFEELEDVAEQAGVFEWLKDIGRTVDAGVPLADIFV